MLAVVLFMVAGMVLGRLLKIRNIGKPVIVMTWLLLLFLGWEAGSDREVIAALPSIGMDSALLSLGGVAGSCLLAWLLWVFMGRKLDSVKAGAKEDGNGVTSEGIKAGGERKLSAWTGFGGSLVILGFFAAGVVGHHKHGRNVEPGLAAQGGESFGREEVDTDDSIVAALRELVI